MGVNFHWILFFFGLIVLGVIAMSLSALFGTNPRDHRTDSRQTRASDQQND
ncbi:hypothetical protein [Paraburkholderia sp. BL21I4N1]|uniref:hypothetical protein n=1 Tax=Paraburkholderia sp. BL21I4N1 TaxID=1938801 RepID=UPI0015E3E9E8|nr:hypothetical protein [Paraburkholderia sp. BL21I4N1]